MSRKRIAGGGKRDTAEKPIVDGLRKIGAEVWLIGGKGNPDVLVRFKRVFSAAEIKTGRGKETKNQGAFPIWRTLDDALKALGIES